MTRPPISIPTATKLLSQVAIGARADREPKLLPDKHFEQVTPTYAEIWFPTAGCPFDALGHCTTCNYGVGPAVRPEQMYETVERAAAELDPATEMVWVSAYNTLFEKEVPAEARRHIFETLANLDLKRVVTETHPASVRRGVIEEVVDTLGGCTFWVELGVETMDEFVRYACVNKPFNNSVLQRAIDTIHDAGAFVYANLLVGLPFLSEQEVINDMRWSVEAAIDAGCDEVVLFPNYLKEHTVAALLGSAQRYRQPDAWALREVLAGVPREWWPHVNLGWLDVKDHPGAAKLLGPAEHANMKQLKDLLRRFNTDHDSDALDEALGLTGPRPFQQGEGALTTRILDDYRWLADHYLPAGWWEDMGAQVTAEIGNAYASSARAVGPRR